MCCLVSGCGCWFVDRGPPFRWTALSLERPKFRYCFSRSKFRSILAPLQAFTLYLGGVFEPEDLKNARVGSVAIV